MTIAKPVEPSFDAKDVLKLRYDARFWLWSHSAFPRVRNCGRVAVNSSSLVPVLRYPDGHVVARGLQHCFSVWACPVCSARLLQLRSQRLANIVEAWRRRGGAVGMVTLTMSHNRNDNLKDLWDDVQAAWSGCIATPAWRRAQDAWGIVIDDGGKKRIPIVKVVETTWGPTSGWHVHIHALLFLPEASKADAALSEIWFGDETRPRSVGLLERWKRQAAKRGHTALGVGQDAHVVRNDTENMVADYLAKAVLDGDVSKELARGDMKVALGQRFTPFQLLSLAAQGEHPEKEKLIAALWGEWETASKGRRQMSISRSLADYLGCADLTGDDDEDGALTDEAAESFTLNAPSGLADKQQYWRVAGPPELVGFVNGATWRDVVAPMRLDSALSRACESRTLDYLFLGAGVTIAHDVPGLLLSVRDAVPSVGAFLSSRYVNVSPKS